ncbi:MAG: efflux RND transporter periplasmic adaptor subunit, partial [Coxiellaceae bacterium]|nr:efflux RND transporter periplasmic adaptor subunit [Coxiellaceae bacterium]
MKPFIRFLPLITLLAVLSACNKKETPKPSPIRPVKSIVIQDKQKEILRSFPGKVLPNKNAQIAFEVPGKIVDITVLKGDKVEKGTLLASLDPKTYQDTVDRDKAKYREANAQFQRAESLVKDNFISRAEYDKLRSNMEIAKANLSTAETNLEYTKVYAHFNGVVANRFVEKFEQVRAKQPVLELQDISTVDIVIDVPENIVLHFKKMQAKEKPTEEEKPHVFFESVPDVSYPLDFKEFTTEADPATQTYSLRFTLKQPENMVVLPGMSVIVKAMIPDVSGTPDEFDLIPSSAVFSDPEGRASVWVIDSETMTVHQRVIEVSKLTGERIRVTNGLKPGD